MKHPNRREFFREYARYIRRVDGALTLEGRPGILPATNEGLSTEALEDEDLDEVEPTDAEARAVADLYRIPDPFVRVAGMHHGKPAPVRGVWGDRKVVTASELPDNVHMDDLLDY